MITYRVDAADVHAHCYSVTLSIPNPAAEQRLSLPVWVPGSYLVREFARHLNTVSAHQGEREVACAKLDKATWGVRTQGAETLVIRYRVYAFDTSVRAAFLDSSRGFFNGTSVLLRVEGREDDAHEIELCVLADGWDVATALTPLPAAAASAHRFRASGYDELVDHPVELGRFWRGAFVAGGVDHEFVVAGALPDFDGARLLRDAARICEAQIAFWHGHGEAASRPPFERYVFLMNAVEDGHGGLEHRASTALIAPRRDLPRLERSPPTTAATPNAQPAATTATATTTADAAALSDGCVSVLSLISHEYFHSWNVKRLRPQEFARYDYTRENYTELLWFFEGFTSYYDDLFVRRAGLIDDARYLQLLARTLTNVAATPGRRVQSLAEASFDAWIKYYRSDENTPNATISYYAKGSLVALALDLRLRAEGAGSLDDVMRALWARSGGGPIAEADIARALERVGGRSYGEELRAWVHGTDELPLAACLAPFAIELQTSAPSMAQRLGVRVSESAFTGIKVSHVLQGGAAERAGLAAGDEILAVEGWRLRRLDEARRLLLPGQTGELLIARDQRLLRLGIALAEGEETGGATLLKFAAEPTPAALALAKAWLSG